MGMDPVTLGVLTLAMTAATTGAGVYSSATQAQQANRFARRQQKAQTHAARIQEKQITEQAGLEKEKVAREAHQIRSTLRVAAGESGVGLGGTYEAVVRQADLDEAMNIEIIDRNAALATQSAYSRIQPMAPRQNALLAGIMGGLGGASAGLSLGTSGMSISQRMGNPPSTQSPYAGDLEFIRGLEP